MIYKTTREVITSPLVTPSLCQHLHSKGVLLNIPAFLDLCHSDFTRTNDGQGNSRSTGKKRRLTEEADDPTPNPKRTKISSPKQARSWDSSFGTHAEANQPVLKKPEEIPDLWADIFPQLWATTAVRRDTEEGSTPVYEHRIEIRFLETPDLSDELSKYNVSWHREVTQLTHALKELTALLSAPSLKPLLRSTLHIESSGNQCIISLPRADDDSPHEDLFIIPNPDKQGILSSLCEESPTPFSLPRLQALQRGGYISIIPSLEVALLPSEGLSEGMLPFHFYITLSVYLRVQNMVKLPNLKRKGYTYDLDEPQVTPEDFILYLLGDRIDTPPPSERNTDIPFFYSILSPAPPVACDTALQPQDLQATLLPFQKRSAAWLLSREGKEIVSGSIMDRPEAPLALFWEPIHCGDVVLYYNRFTHETSIDLQEVEEHPHGAILAEEPGLGKTLESIALIMLNKPPPARGPSIKWYDKEANLEIKQIKTTLIVTPPALAIQWKEELARHAPTLKVYEYPGFDKLDVPVTEEDTEKARKKRMKAVRKRKDKAMYDAITMDMDDDDLDKLQDKLDNEQEEEEEVLEWTRFIDRYDVCIVTYDNLRGDLYVARAPPSRPRREDVTYRNLQRPRSPLVSCEWFRVIMDEVQMAKGGKTEEMVSLVPRLNSLAVSGTPARSQISDLIQVLRFLRVKGVQQKKSWNQLLKPENQHFFVELCQRYAIRTLKSTVQDELTIPKQTRYVVGIHLSAIEKQVYDQTLDLLLEELGLDIRGVPATENWEADPVLLRSMIRQLRGICTHPQVGQQQNNNVKLSKPGALKTMSEVLEAMRDQNWKDLMESCRIKIQSQTKLSQLLLRAQTNQRGRTEALELLLAAERDANAMIQEISNVLNAKSKLFRELRARHDSPISEDLSEDEDDDEDQHRPQEKGKGRAVDENPMDIDIDDSHDSLRTRAQLKELRIQRQGLTARLRETRVILHHVKFTQGDVYHVLGQKYQADEEAAYEAAEKIRSDLLRVTEEVAQRAIAQLTDDVSVGKISHDMLKIKSPLFELDPKAELPVDLGERVREANDIVRAVLNEQTDLLLEWRAKIVGLLVQRISQGDDATEVDGQEYQRALDNQVEADVWIQAYTALLADRRESLINERTLLAAHDAREKRLRTTKAAAKAAAALENIGYIVPEVPPEHEVQLKELHSQRRTLVGLMQGRALKGIQFSISSLVASARSPEAKSSAKRAVAELRSLISSQEELNEILDADLIRIRKAFNDRVQYFRQLQEISDSVAEPEIDGRIADVIEGCRAEQVVLSGSINERRARVRYLTNLADQKSTEDEDEDEKCCILCRCDFARGYITQCAHAFCEDCLKLWVKRKEGKTCPVCRSPVDPAEVQRFTTDEPPEEPAGPVHPRSAGKLRDLVPMSRRKIVYNCIGSDLLSRIKEREIEGSFSEKICTLVQHLLHVQEEEPGAKSIVFSAWADSLQIVEYALRANGLFSIRVDRKRKGRSAAHAFANDPTISVLLLHGERENAGLNVTCASRVFLLESVVHHGFEIQAIARIDRMGQTKPTEVFCYYAEETVEKNILDLAARAGLSIYTKDNASKTVNVTDLDKIGEGTKNNMDAPGAKKNQKGDFIFKVDDMLAILFPHMFEDVEFLLPEDEAVSSKSAVDNTGNQALSDYTSYACPARGPRWTGGDNAVAGPSHNL